MQNYHYSQFFSINSASSENSPASFGKPSSIFKPFSYFKYIIFSPKTINYFEKINQTYDPKPSARHIKWEVASSSAISKNLPPNKSIVD